MFINEYSLQRGRPVLHEDGCPTTGNTLNTSKPIVIHPLLVQHLQIPHCRVCEKKES